METIKSAIGLGQKSQEGQEPASGQQGAGTAGEPYDQGNVVGMFGTLHTHTAYPHAC